MKYGEKKNQICRVGNLVKIYTVYNNSLLIMTEAVFNGLCSVCGDHDAEEVDDISYEGKNIFEVTFTSKGYVFNKAGSS